MSRFLRCLLICISPVLCFASPFVAGTHYQIIKLSPQMPSLAPTKSAALSGSPGDLAPKTVVEFFNPGCPACAALEPSLEKWLKTKPTSWTFMRVPLVYHPQWLIYAKAYHVAELLGVEDQIVPILFNIIQTQRQKLQAVKDYQGIFENLNVDDDDLAAAWANPALDERIQRDKALMEKYQIMQIPTIIVSGKYLTNMSMTKTPQRLIDTVNYLMTLPA